MSEDRDDIVIQNTNRRLVMIVDEIRDHLYSCRDESYRKFQSKLIPAVYPENIIGVRTPELRSYAKILSKRDDIVLFLKDLPHKYFDENQIHAFIISGIKDYSVCLNELNAFLPYIDNWATCDQTSPKVFKKHRNELESVINEWLHSKEIYTVRFGIKMLMEHYLDEDFDPRYFDEVASIRSDEYYVNMMIAWYFATALAKQYESAVRYIETKRLDVWVHNKAIQKSVESYRISPEHKEYLKSLRIKSVRH